MGVLAFFLGLLFGLFGLFAFACLNQFGLSQRGRRVFVMSLVAGVIAGVIIQIIIIAVVIANGRSSY